MNSKRGNLFSEIPETINNEIFETILNTESFSLERIVSQGQITPAGQWLKQDNDEWVVLLRGSAEFIFEGDEKSFRMNPGDYVYIAAKRRHRVEWTDTNQKTVWLAIHYPK